MAIGYSGPRAQTMLLNVQSGIQVGGVGTEQAVYIHTQMAQLQPILTTPFILDIIKNSNSTDGTDSFANSRYYYAQKAGEATQTTGADSQLINDPRKIESEDIKVLVAQIAPEAFAKKFSGALRDLQTKGLENAAAAQIATFIQQRRSNKEIRAFKMAIDAAEKVQKNIVKTYADATTFEKGAHYVEETYTDSESLYNDVNDAINSFATFGMPSSSCVYNKDLQYCLGIPQDDMVLIMPPRTAGLLLKTPGLYASDKGNELFQKANLKEVLGVPLYVTNALPSGTNFVLMTTGTHGAIGYENCGKIAQGKIGGKEMSVLEGSANMVPDPAWSGFYRIDCEDVFKLGIVFADNIIVSSQNVSVASLSDRKASRAIKNDYENGMIDKNDILQFIQSDTNAMQNFKNQLATLKDKIKEENSKKEPNKKVIKEIVNEIKALEINIDVSQKSIERFQSFLKKIESKEADNK